MMRNSRIQKLIIITKIIILKYKVGTNNLHPMFRDQLSWGKWVVNKNKDSGAV